MSVILTIIDFTIEIHCLLTFQVICVYSFDLVFHCSVPDEKDLKNSQLRCKGLRDRNEMCFMYHNFKCDFQHWNMFCKLMLLRNSKNM